MDRARMPATLDDFERYVAGTAEELEVTPQAASLADAILHPPVPPELAPARPAMRTIAAGLLPPPLRPAYGLAWTGRRRAAFQALCATSRAAVRSFPPRIRFWPHHRAALGRLDAGVGPEPWL